MTDQEKRDDFIQGLRDAADFFEQHPDIPMPYSQTMNVFVDTKDEMARIARLTSWEKEYGGDWFILRRMFGKSLKLEINIAREQVCRRVVVGKKTIPAREAQIVDDVIWECDDLSLLSTPPADYDGPEPDINNELPQPTHIPEEEERRRLDMANEF